MTFRKTVLFFSLLAAAGVFAQIDTRSLVSKAKGGDVKSQYALAVMCENNAQNTPDWNEAAWWYRHAAEQGDVDAQRRLAWCYENGKGVDRDFDRAILWYLKAAERGDSISQFQVGKIYREISQDYEKSFTWFHRSSESGYPPALNAVGECYREGFGVPQNHYSAVEWFRKAAEMYDPDANYNLGRAYQFGFGVDESVSSARSYYEEAIRLGHPAAVSALNKMSFRIVGNIKGLVPGDTLRFERIYHDGLIHLGAPVGFKVVVSEPDRFDYDGIQNHAQYYRMVYSPASGSYDGYVADGLNVLVENGEYRIEGDVADIYLSSVSGGCYDDSMISTPLRLISVLSKKEASILRDIDKARRKGDSKKEKVRKAALAELEVENSVLHELARQEIEKFKILNPSSMLTVVDYLENFSDYSLDDLRSAYNALDSAAVESYYGKVLIDKIMRNESVSVGCKMPFFALISSWHQPVSLNNLLGKYSLIYYWDTGAASRKVDPEVMCLAEQYSDRLEVVGVTPSEKPLEQVRRDDKYSTLLKHKWKDCEFNESNKASLELMSLDSAPYFILLSPEGVILDRGRESVLETLGAELYK